MKKVTTSFKPSNNEDVINKTFLDESFTKIEARISYIGKDHQELILHNNKQSVEEVLVQKSLKTTFINILR